MVVHYSLGSDGWETVCLCLSLSSLSTVLWGEAERARVHSFLNIRGLDESMLLVSWCALHAGSSVGKRSFDPKMKGVRHFLGSEGLGIQSFPFTRRGCVDPWPWWCGSPHRPLENRR